MPVGRVPPKSVAFAWLVPDPVTAQLALLLTLISPVRIIVKVKAFMPAFPSVWVALVEAITSAVSSLVMIPVAVAVIIVALVGLERVTVSSSSGSTVVSPDTLTVMV